ncbi:hypothetical protein L6452_03157 [Arctium lappa]|uniref:Uncharacterized protein n=1 Tax=Arctium lappa TaxID=4217 RepID=A0ACB9FKW5_ARCLA|nr:hypothetical protein L6452_03157 [Arctium lappa]
MLSSIQFSLGNISELHFLDLSSNLLQGCLPDSVEKLSKLWFPDLLYNSLVSEVTGSHFVNVSMLSGVIPNSIGHLDVSGGFEQIVIQVMRGTEYLDVSGGFEQSVI